MLEVYHVLVARPGNFIGHVGPQQFLGWAGTIAQLEK